MSWQSLARGYGGDNFAATLRVPEPVAVLVAYLEFAIDTDQHRRLRPDVEIVIRPPVGAAYRYE